jgi:hypothetical protein
VSIFFFEQTGSGQRPPDNKGRQPDRCRERTGGGTRTMEMEATGKSKGEWILYKEFDRTVDYLSDHARILALNPFCHKVEETDIENIFKWHFRVSDPQNNPFDIIFYVRQTDELLVELPDHIVCTNPDDLTDEMIRDYTVGKKITWRQHPHGEEVEDHAKFIFEGKASADMLILPFQSDRTRVNFDLKIDVRFVLYPAFRIIPEQIIRNMANAGMSFIMQTATNKMFQRISTDFAEIHRLPSV